MLISLYTGNKEETFSLPTSNYSEATLIINKPKSCVWLY